MPEITLRGMTWDHARGFDPMVATATEWSRLHPDVTITWEKRSLQAFADRPIREMADTYDLMVIDHPHVGEVAAEGNLLALDIPEHEAGLTALAEQSVGLSHPSYVFGGRQWALAIDAATPVAAFRPDRIDAAPTRWQEAKALAARGQVGFALIPVNALMTYLGLARNMDYPVADDPAHLMQPDHATHILEELREIVALIDARCLTLDPIGVYEWMGRDPDGPAYSPFGYGYTNYSRAGFCPHPLVFADAPGFGENGPRGTVLGGTGIAVSAYTCHPQTACDYAFWIAGADCQRGIYFAAGGQPGNAVAWEDADCNAACRNFFRRTRRTHDTAWLRPRYNGYMQLQDIGGDIVHACLSGTLTVPEAIAHLDDAYRKTRG